MEATMKQRRWPRRIAVTIGMLVVIVALIAGAWIVLLSSREETPPSALAPVNSKLYDLRYAQAADAALQILQEAQAKRHFPSVSMAVGVNGQVVWAGTVGYEEVASGRPATIESRYYINSVAKFFTSVALGNLVDAGVINLDDSFAQRVTDFPPFKQDFTLRQLQQHKAGIRHWRVRNTFNQQYYLSVQQQALEVANEDLLFAPGTATSYSTPGYTLLALAMERASGEDYLSLMQRLVFDPAGMDDTFADTVDRTTEHVTIPYLVADDAMVRLPQFNASDRWAGGGFLSTTSDVVRFGNAVLQGDMVSEAFRANMLRRVQADPRYPSVFADEHPALGLKLTGGGTGWSGRANLSLYPGQGVVVATATNTRPADNQGAGIDEDAIASLFAKAKAP